MSGLLCPSGVIAPVNFGATIVRPIGGSASISRAAQKCGGASRSF
jgi:hypothetical protein